MTTQPSAHMSVFGLIFPNASGSCCSGALYAGVPPPAAVVVVHAARAGAGLRGLERLPCLAQEAPLVALGRARQECLDRDVLRRLPGPRKHALVNYPAAASPDNLRRVLDVVLAEPPEDGGIAQLVPRHPFRGLV